MVLDRSFIIQGLPLGQDMAVVRIGLRKDLAKDITLNAEYIGEFSRNRQDQALQAKIEYRF